MNRNDTRFNDATLPMHKLTGDAVAAWLRLTGAKHYERGIPNAGT